MISIEKLKNNKVRITGNLNEMNFFIEEQVDKLSNIEIVSDNTVSCIIDNTDNVFIDNHYLDHLDDVLFFLVQNYAITFNKDIDFNAIEHTHILIDLKEEIFNILNNYKSEEENMEQVTVTAKLKVDGKNIIVCENSEGNCYQMDVVNLIDHPNIGEKYSGTLKNDTFFAIKRI